MQNLDEAYRMLYAFASVGARHFDVTFLDIDSAKRGFRKEQSVMQLRNSLPKLLPGLTERKNSIVVRPHAEDVTLVQLDDLDTTGLERLKDVAFLTLCTSPGNHQAWVAVNSIGRSSTNQQEQQEHQKSAGAAGHAGLTSKELGRRLRKGTGADLSASGAVRLAGTCNYKRKYGPEFPTVSIENVAPGRIVTPDQLEELGLLASPEPVRAAPLRVSHSTAGRSWPDYERCVAGAPPNNSKESPDISRADFTWALMALRRGQSVEDTASRLAELSSKARENGDSYAMRTAQNAAAAVDRERQRSRA
jgi:hypothetical protein